jgi:ribosome-binding protein aMBF1 (putative translation factor)
MNQMRTAREKLGLTLQDLAIDIRSHYPTVCQVERGDKRTPQKREARLRASLCLRNGRAHAGADPAYTRYA